MLLLLENTLKGVQGRALIKKINSNVVYMDHLLRTYSLSYGQFYVLNRRYRKRKVKRF